MPTEDAEGDCGVVLLGEKTAAGLVRLGDMGGWGVVAVSAVRYKALVGDLGDRGGGVTAGDSISKGRMRGGLLCVRLLLSISADDDAKEGPNTFSIISGAGAKKGRAGLLGARGDESILVAVCNVLRLLRKAGIGATA